LIAGSVPNDRGHHSERRRAVGLRRRLDGFTLRLGGRADVVAALARRLDTGGTVGLHQAHDAQARSEALLWGFAFMMVSTNAMVAGPILAASRIMRCGVHSA